MLFFVTMALQYDLKSGMVIPPMVSFLFRTSLAILGLLCLHMKIGFAISVKNVIVIFIGITLSL